MNQKTFKPTSVPKLELQSFPHLKEETIADDRIKVHLDEKNTWSTLVALGIHATYIYPPEEVTQLAEHLPLWEDSRRIAKTIVSYSRGELNTHHPNSEEVLLCLNEVLYVNRIMKFSSSLMKNVAELYEQAKQNLYF